MKLWSFLWLPDFPVLVLSCFSGVYFVMKISDCSDVLGCASAEGSTFWMVASDWYLLSLLGDALKDSVAALRSCIWLGWRSVCR